MTLDRKPRTRFFCYTCAGMTSPRKVGSYRPRRRNRRTRFYIEQYECGTCSTPQPDRHVWDRETR